MNLSEDAAASFHKDLIYFLAVTGWLKLSMALFHNPFYVFFFSLKRHVVKIHCLANCP